MDASLLFWHTLTRLGEAQILLPAMAAVLAWFVLRLRALPVATAWGLCLLFATVLTTATKVAFIGWGLGYAPLNFTGISGHSMFAAAVLPVLALTTASTATPRTQAIALAAGYALAALVAVSRVMVLAHSPSEALAGFALGSLASGASLALARAPHTHAPKAMAVGVALWLVLGSAGAPPSRTHDWVTRLSLAVSGHSQPYTRAMLLHRYRLQQQAPTLRG